MHRNFHEWAREQFSFLCDGDEFCGPELLDDGLAYHATTLTIEVRQEQRERDVVTLLRRRVGDREVRAELSCVYREAALGPVQDVKGSAGTEYSLRRSLQSQSAALQRLLPLLAAPEGNDLLARCHAK